MATKRSMLPPNATRLERAFEGATDKLRAPDVHALWNAYDCEERLLPWLARAMGVEVWDDAWPVSVKRSTIAAAMKIARHRGSVWAVKEALVAAGYAGAEIEEGLPPLRHNGAQLRDGLETYGGGNRWAMFRLIADLGEDKGVSGKELGQLTELVNNAKPARSQLTEIEYRASVADVAAPAEAPGFTARWAALKNLPPFMAMVWRARPGRTLAMILLRLVRAVLPVPMLWIGKLIIDEVVRLGALQTRPEGVSDWWQSGLADYLGLLIAAELGLALASDLIGRLVGYADSLLQERLVISLSVRLMDHAADLDLASFEDAGFQDRLDRARRQTMGRIPLVGQMMQQLQDGVTVPLQYRSLQCDQWGTSQR
jgi:hypothetical protein